MNARNVSSKYALGKMVEQIRELVGDPTGKVVSLSGNVFYINDVAHAISKVQVVSILLFNPWLFDSDWTNEQDYANPITHAAMMDYPRLKSGGQMEQVQNASKMLDNLPGEIVSPAVKVNSQVYCVNELLKRKDGGYFIPQCFFFYPILVPALSTSTAPSSSTNPAKIPATVDTLCSLGRRVTQTPVCLFCFLTLFSKGLMLLQAGFMVHDTPIIVEVNTFAHNFEMLEEKNIMSCGFVGMCFQSVIHIIC